MLLSSFGDKLSEWICSLSTWIHECSVSIMLQGLDISTITITVASLAEVFVIANFSRFLYVTSPSIIHTFSLVLSKEEREKKTLNQNSVSRCHDLLMNVQITISIFIIDINIAVLHRMTFLNFCWTTLHFDNKACLTGNIVTFKVKQVSGGKRKSKYTVYLQGDFYLKAPRIYWKEVFLKLTKKRRLIWRTYKGREREKLSITSQYL